MFEVLMAENFPNLVNDINPQIHQTKLFQRPKTNNNKNPH